MSGTTRHRIRCPECQGEGFTLRGLDGEWPCTLCGGVGSIEDGDEEDGDWDEYFHWLAMNEPERHALDYDAGYSNPAGEQVTR